MMKLIILSTSILVIIICVYGILSQLNDERPSIYWVNFNPESEDVLLELGAKYQERTGRNVSIVSPGADGYGELFKQELLNSSSSATIFVYGDLESIDKYNDYFYNLTNTKIELELNINEFKLYTSDNKLAGIGYYYETFGIITNIELLEKSGHTLDEIKDFASLKSVVENIHSKADKLGFDAFTSSGLNKSSWRFSAHLANVPLFYESRDDKWKETPSKIKGTYLKNYKNLWDLYINNSPYKPDTLLFPYNPEEEFGKKQAVFYQNGNWEYDILVNNYGLNPEKLTMIPLYSGVEGEENAGLSSGTENYLAVNAKASMKDIEATLEFMYWMVTEPDATKMLATTFGSIPYKKAAVPDNIFLSKAQEYIKKGKYTMTWVFNYTPNQKYWRQDVVSALFEYSKESTEENWKKVETAFIEGWERQYKNIQKK